MGDSPGKRLILFRNSLGLSQREFAASIGVSQGSIAFIERDERTPSRRFLERISDRYSISADWLLYGVGEMHHAPQGFGGSAGPMIEPPDASRPMHGDFAADGEEYSLIRRLDLDASAKSGLAQVENGERERIAFPRTWLTENRLSADLCALVRVTGNSNVLRLPDGSLALVNVAETQVDDDGVFALIQDGEAVFRQLSPMAPSNKGKHGGFAIMSPNPVRPLEFVTWEEAGKIRIIGRVRWAMVNL